MLTTFLPLKLYGIFFVHTRAANSADSGRILSSFQPIQDFIAVLVTYKNEIHPIKYEGARVLTTLYFDLSDAQEQLT